MLKVLNMCYLNNENVIWYLTVWLITQFPLSSSDTISSLVNTFISPFRSDVRSDNRLAVRVQWKQINGVVGMFSIIVTSLLFLTPATAPATGGTRPLTGLFLFCVYYCLLKKTTSRQPEQNKTAWKCRYRKETINRIMSKDIWSIDI